MAQPFRDPQYCPYKLLVYLASYLLTYLPQMQQPPFLQMARVFPLILQIYYLRMYDSVGALLPPMYTAHKIQKYLLLKSSLKTLTFATANELKKQEGIFSTIYKFECDLNAKRMNREGVYKLSSVNHHFLYIVIVVMVLLKCTKIY